MAPTGQTHRVASCAALIQPGNRRRPKGRSIGTESPSCGPADRMPRTACDLPPLVPQSCWASAGFMARVPLTLPSEFCGPFFPNNGPQTCELMTNPCLRCTVDQNCCRDLHGLLLNEAEYQRHFAGRSDHLSIARDGRVYRLSSNGRGPCPNWDMGCAIHADRPMDCALYPYTIGNIFEEKGKVYATYHSRTECPLSAEIIQPRQQAEQLIHDFLKRTYGEETEVAVRHDEGASRLYHLARRAAAKSGKILSSVTR